MAGVRMIGYVEDMPVPDRPAAAREARRWDRIRGRLEGVPYSRIGVTKPTLRARVARRRR